MAITEQSIPSLWKLARLDFDPVRQRRVLLYPEGVVLLNDSGAAILELCDGERSVAAIAADLQSRFHVDVLADVLEYLDDLVNKELVRVR
jgi:pyrroloquinoline quinone biosynthesis protein D